MSTQLVLVPAGKVSDPIPLTPQQNLLAGPQVLGGTVLVETASNLSGPWFPWSLGSSGAAGSVRPSVNSWARVTATTQAAIAAISNLGSALAPQFDTLFNLNAVIATPSSTAEQILASIRIPPNFLPLNWRMKFGGQVSLTNNANVKTLNLKVNGTGGTAMFTSPSLASQLNYNFMAWISGMGDGLTMKGSGAAASGGIGVSTTAYATLARDYVNNETEIVLTATKATGTDTFQVDALTVQLW